MTIQLIPLYLVRCIRLVVVCSLFSVSLVAQALEVKAASVSDLTFTLIDSGNAYEVSDCDTSASGALAIPATYSGKPVTSIGVSAFKSCSGLTSVTIPDSVTNIGEEAFYLCNRLTSVTIPSSVTSIGDFAFAYSGLTSVIIPDSVTIIQDGVFSECWNMTSVTIPNSITSIGSGAFWWCGLTSVMIPDSVTSIGENAFIGCRLTSVTIPDSVTSIGNGAFDSCSNLTGVTIPDSVTSIGDGAFAGCSNLASVTFGGDAPSAFGSGVFNSVASGFTVYYYNTAVGFTEPTWEGYPSESIMDPAVSDLTFTLIDSENAYEVSDCNTSASGALAIPATYNGKPVISIGASAFDNCDGLTSIALPDSVTNIGEFAFAFCGSLTSITLPDSLTSIGDWAFYECMSLTSITLPDSLTSIGDYAFQLCTSLTSITIPDGVTSIGVETFYFCENLTSVTIPDSVTSIGEKAFYSCDNLTSVTIPASVTSIGSGAFAESANLLSIQVDTANTAYTSVAGVLFDKSQNTLFVYPAGKADTSYSVPNSVTSIEVNAFRTCENLTSVTIPGSVTSIGDTAFASCDNLVSATFEGDAPSTFGSDVFNLAASGFTVYYYSSAAGFTEPTWEGYPSEKIMLPPEIAVDYDDTNIEDGDSAPSVSKGTDFGSKDEAEGAETKTYTVRNTGSGTLTLGTPTSDSSEFIVSGLADSIDPGSSDTFTIAFDPDSAGTKQAIISFDTNDSDENPFNFSVSGIGTTTAPDDHGDSEAAATAISLNSTALGELGNDGDNDYFSISVSEPGNLTVYTSGSTNTEGTLLDSSGAPLSTDDDSGEGVNFSVSYEVDAGTYYIRVQGSSDDVLGVYELAVSFASTQSEFWSRDGWVYYSWPYAYSSSDSKWYYFNESDDQWRVNMSTGDWGTMNDDTGWLYFTWPYVYSIEDSVWYWYDSASVQWVFDLVSGVWSLFGE